MNDTSLIAFKAIVNFINDLSEEYGKRHRSLKLYRRLINKTQISHDKAIEKHLKAFMGFCVTNREQILEKDSDFKQPKISYSERVYVNMHEIFKIADRETAPIIWKHLLILSALLDPAGKAKEVLKKNAEDGKNVNESEFLSNIISKVENNVNPDANPMEAVSSIMQSGVFNDLLGGMQGGMESGNLDISKLLGAVQGMVSSLGNQVGDDPEAKNAMGMLNSMTSMMGNMGEAANSGNGAPDMSGLMQMMGGMMGAMGQTQGQGPHSVAAPPGPDIKDVSEEKKD
jgi:hypothetical protein